MSANALPTALAATDWQAMLRQCVAADPSRLDATLAGWQNDATADNAELALIKSLLSMVGQDTPLASWTTAYPADERLRGGVYSPVQLLVWRCAQTLRAQIEFDYPFHFRLIALTAQLILDASSGTESTGSWPPPDDRFYQVTRRLLQSTFQLRELREEGEPLSIEIKIPAATDSTSELELKRFAQVFGRGVGVAQGENLARLADARGTLESIWFDHKGAPISTLYHLDKPFELIPPEELRLILRRDGLVTIASRQNPLLEFYDGGWHVVDLSSGIALVEELLVDKFGVGGVAPGLTEAVVALAYHMATHWHPGILGVIDLPGASDLLEVQSSESIRTCAMIVEAVTKPDELPKPVRITDLKNTGLGRVLLTAAIQDGATLFGPDGTYLSSGRMLKSIGANVAGGAGTRAAKMLGTYGVALKVSRDGGIRVFAGDAASNRLPSNGIRVR